MTGGLVRRSCTDTTSFIHFTCPVIYALTLSTLAPLAHSHRITCEAVNANSLPKVFSRSEDLRESDGEVKDGQHHLDNTLATH